MAASYFLIGELGFFSMAARRFFLLSADSLLIQSLLLTMMNFQGLPFPELGARQLSLIISLTTSTETSLSSKSRIDRLFTSRSKKSIVCPSNIEIGFPPTEKTLPVVDGADSNYI